MLLELLFLISGFLFGSLPLGGWFIRAATGKDAADFSAHNLGLENLWYFIGAPVAIASFFLDVLKAFVVLALTGGTLWAALGIYLGHLYPLPFTREALPRGRGNGVLLGIFAGLWTFGGAPWWLAALPVLVYAALLGASSYTTLATCGGLVVFGLAVWLTPQGLSFEVATALLLGVAVWRHKAGLLRILDRTEPQLGAPPAVLGRDPNVVLAAFMIHPLTSSDLWQPKSNRWVNRALGYKLIPERLMDLLLEYVSPQMRPQVSDEITGIELSDGRELRVLIIGGPMLPEQIRAQPEQATRMAIRGARLARSHGAEAFGLGGFWSTVGKKGQDVQEAVPNIAITNGGAYTAASVKAAVPGLLQAFSNEGRNLRKSCAAVVGANGVVAFGIARTIAGEVGELVLIGRDKERLGRSAATLRRKYPDTLITTSLDVADCRRADLVFTATSDPDPVLFAEHVKPQSWLFDLGRPADVADEVRSVPGVRLIPGGVVRPPGAMRHAIDLHFGEGQVPACMAETMLMTATRAFDKQSLGASTKSANIQFYLEQGEALGFEIVTRDESDEAAEALTVEVAA